MHSREKSLFVALTLCLVTSACAVEDETDAGLGDRASRVERAEQQVSLALENYADCESEPDPVCASEEDEIAAALVALDEVRGDDAVVFRTSVTASCSNGTSVSCSGNTCYASDNLGCACVAGAILQSVGACPTTTNNEQ